MSNFDSLPSIDTLVYSYVKTLILNQLFQSDGISKINELADRLTNSQLSNLTLKNFLVSDAKTFTYLDRYWIPTTRINFKGLSAQRNVKAIIESLNAPIAINILAQEVSRVSSLNFETSLMTIQRLAKHDPELFLTQKDEVGLAKWVFRAQHESTVQALKANQISEELFNFYKETLAQIDWNDKQAFNKASTLLSEISIKTIGAVAWEKLKNSDNYHLKQFDWRNFYTSLLSLENWVYCEGFLFPKSIITQWEAKASITATYLKSEITLESTHLDIKTADIEKITNKISLSSSTITAKELLEEFFEIFPNMSNYEKDSQTLTQKLIEQKEVQWLGGDRLRSIQDFPEHIQSIPELFYFEKSSLKNDLNELIDFEVSDDGLNSSSVSIMNHPLAIDVLDAEGYTSPTITSDTYRFVLKSMHRELGTFPLCQFPTNWISLTPAIQEIILINPEGKQLHVWANAQIGLLFDLFDWWYEQPIESGAVFTLTKTPQPNVFQFRWEDMYDPIVYISSQKMETLRSIDPTDKSTFELLCTLFQHWSKGVDFLTLLWEINIVRRSTRRLIASLLNSYECFYQRSGSSLWFFDAKKIGLGINKGKKRFIIK